jgi:RND family efflux transporter MFP subunit
MRLLLPVTGAATLALLLAGCGTEPESAPPARATITGTPVAVIDTAIADEFTASGTAEPIRAATLSTKLMATVTEVRVHEGDHVTAGQLLVQLDARDLEAKRSQVEAGLANANAVYTDAAAQAGRIRGLYADSAATRAQLDQVEAGLARAEAGVRMAKAQAAELQATATYAEVRAPFGGTVTGRFVDPGAFAAPGAPLVTVQDAGTLRIVVRAAPDAVAGLRRGATVRATVGDTVVDAKIEGVVPSGGNLYTVNALVNNTGGRLLSGSAASLALPRGERTAIVVPAAALVHQDDLIGVRAMVAGEPALRWIRVGRSIGDGVEVLAGLAVGDTVLVPAGVR